MNLSSREFTLPVDPTPLELNQALSICANNIARLSDLVAQYKADAAIKQTAYKRAHARARVKYSNAKNSDTSKALTEIDEEVIAAQNELDQANAVFLVAMGEMEGYEAQFIALRKIVEIRKMEARTI